MSETCSICLDSNFVDSTTHEKRKFITKCNHLYHHDCIYRWAQQNNSCPTCRTGNLIEEFIGLNYNNILSSITNTPFNISYNIDHATFNNFDIYIDNLNNLFINYYRNLFNNDLPLILNIDNSTSNNIIILPNNSPPSSVINFRMSMNNSNRHRINQRLRYMNFI